MFPKFYRYSTSHSVGCFTSSKKHKQPAKHAPGTAARSSRAIDSTSAQRPFEKPAAYTDPLNYEKSQAAQPWVAGVKANSVSKSQGVSPSQRLPQPQTPGLPMQTGPNAPNPSPSWMKAAKRVQNNQVAQAQPRPSRY